MKRLPVLLAFLLCAQFLPAARLEVGLPREEVIAALGEPAGRSSAGSREVLSYPAGRVFLRDGRVEDFDPALAPAPAPSSVTEPSPAVAPAVAVSPPEEDHGWIKLAGLTVFLGVVLLLGRHWIRVAQRAQAERKRGPLNR